MNSRVLGFVLLAVGLALLLFGLNATDSVTDSVSEGLTGKYTDKTMWFIIGGIAASIGGLAMVFLGRRGRLTT
jgi:hypothetical protein